MQTPRLERTASEETAARAAREKEAVREAKRATLEEKRAERAARKAEREAAREARARAAGKDSRRDDDGEETDEVFELDLVEDGQTWDEVTALAREVEAAGASILNLGIGWHEARVPTIITQVPRAAWRDSTARLRAALREAGIATPVCASNRINTPDVAEDIASGESAVVIHGVDHDGSGTYDGDVMSDLDPSLPTEATDPALCGVLVAAPSGGVATGAGSTAGSENQGLMIAGGAALLAAAGAGLVLGRRARTEV